MRSRRPTFANFASRRMPVCQRDARRLRPPLALQVVILREQRGRRCIGFVVKSEQLCAGLILLVRLETERQVEG